MNKLTLKWDAELEHDIRKMVPMDGGRALVILDWSYKRLTCFCLETRSVRWTHRLRKGEFSHLFLAAFGSWIFVQREVGSKEDFLLFHAETGECRELSGLSGCCFLLVLYRDGAITISSAVACSVGERTIIRVNCVTESGLRLLAFDGESAESLWSYDLSKGVSIEGSAGGDCPIQLLRGVPERLDPEDADWRGFRGVRQLDLLTGEVSDLIDEPIASEVCVVEAGLFFTRLEKGRKSLSYGEFSRGGEGAATADADLHHEPGSVGSSKNPESEKDSGDIIPFQFFDSALMLMIEGKAEPEADFESLGGVFLELNGILMVQDCDLSAFVSGVSTAIREGRGWYV